MLVAPFKPAHEVGSAVAQVLRPPRRISPSEAVSGSLRNDRGELDIAATPYLIEPLDRLADRTYQGISFVGPARTGKTFVLAIGGIYYVVTVAPADVLAIYMSQDTARDFSRLELDRAIANTPELAALLSPRARDDNTYDKFFRNGIALKIGWPAATQLRGKTVRYVMLMDYDGGPIGDVDKRGSMWGQAFKRIETYMSRGKCIAESSPGADYDVPDWRPETPHEAPPARGIASIYNSGTRARWYFRCQSCREAFQAEPGLAPFLVPEFEEVESAVSERHDLMMLAESWAKVPCPKCGTVHEPEQRSAMNAVRTEGDRIRGATWLHEGQSLVDDRIEGTPRRTNIASYWLGGVAAAYQPWVGLVYAYLEAVAKYVRTGDESDMRRSSFEDQAWPYLPMAIRRKRSTEAYASRKESWERGTAPAGVRYLTAAVDVQKRRFVVQVHGWGVGLESWLVDRFQIFTSERKGHDGQPAPLNPADFVEDWLLLERLVVEREYVAEGVDVKFKPELVLCDSGGVEGVTDRAYEFWRRMRDKGLGNRIRLLKGASRINAPRIHEAFPDSRSRKDRSAGRGDVPVWMLNTNLIKDGVSKDLDRTEPGPRYIHIPEWVDEEYFDELAAEIRTAKGWERRGQMSNEAFDLHTYNRAACIILGAEGIDWNAPPPWAIDPRMRAAKPKQPPQPKRSDWLATRRRGNFW